LVSIQPRHKRLSGLPRLKEVEVREELTLVYLPLLASASRSSLPSPSLLVEHERPGAYSSSRAFITGLPQADGAGASPRETQVVDPFAALTLEHLRLGHQLTPQQHTSSAPSAGKQQQEDLRPRSFE
jgi:hypothetical protein